MHTVDFEVRDSELDAQGVVNNAYYFIYMAHARHKYIAKLGIDFVEMAKQGQNLFLIASNLEFKQSLKSGENFTVTSELVPEGKIKFAFKQTIAKSDGSVVATGHNICVCIDETNRRRPYLPELISKAITRNVDTLE
jgi:acyl-CoA thioester hydrolase